MPKRVGYLYEKMCDRDLIRLAIMDGSKGKRKRWDVKIVLENLDEYVERMYRILAEYKFVPTQPRLKEIYDRSCQKRRIIQIVPFFPDGIMHQLCVMVMQPVLMRGMYRWSCASIPGRGNSCAAKYVRKALDNDPRGTKYCLKMDVRQFYPSISVKRLIRLLARKIKDKRFLRTIYAIASSASGNGLAIGFYINQWLANFYLEGLDRYILGLQGVTYYVRNMDDMVLLGPNKKQLHRARKAIAVFLNRHLRLDMKPDWQVFPVRARAIDFVGFRFYRTHTTMRRRNFLRFARQCRRVLKMLRQHSQIPYHEAAGLLARVGQLKHCNCLGIRKTYFDPIGRHALLDVVRAYSAAVCVPG